jgi:hypothetical protein
MRVIKGVVSLLLLLLSACAGLHLAEDEEEGVVAPEDEGYTRAGDLLYKTEWKPRDCIGTVYRFPCSDFRLLKASVSVFWILTLKTFFANFCRKLFAEVCSIRFVHGAKS